MCILYFCTAWLSAIGKFPQTLFFPASIACYFWAAYRTAKYANIWGTMSFGAFLGLVDGTLGWKIPAGWAATRRESIQI